MKLYEYYNKEHLNPTGFELRTKEQLDIHTNKRNNLYVNKLKIPNLIWNNADVLEIGCASGENSLVLAKLGAKLTLVEPLSYLINDLKELFNHWNSNDSINDIYTSRIQDVHFDKRFDIIIAEGVISTLSNRGTQVRNIFNNLKRDGLFILSISDPIGNFLEYFKIYIARIYLNDKENKVELSKGFFLEDYDRIPHSRDYESWIKDILLNPLHNSKNLYGFDELIGDLYDLNPIYHISHPDYRYKIDYKWYKYIPDYDAYMEAIISGYKRNSLSFILGEHIPYDDTAISLIRNAIKMMNSLDGEDEITDNLKMIMNCVDGNLKKHVIPEMINVIKDINPSTYKNCKNLRRYWGVPNHYIVLRHE